jgi:hypothetical protein
MNSANNNTSHPLTGNDTPDTLSRAFCMGGDFFTAVSFAKQWVELSS